MMERLFTLEEANDLVPWLEERFEAMSPLRAELVARQETLLSLLRRRRSNGHSSSEEEIAAAEHEAARLTRRLQDAVKRDNRQPGHPGTRHRPGPGGFPIQPGGRNRVPLLATRRGQGGVVAPDGYGVQRAASALGCAWPDARLSFKT